MKHSPDLEQRLKSLVRQRQRIWQMMVPGHRGVVMWIQCGDMKVMLRGIPAMRLAERYLAFLNDRIRILTDLVNGDAELGSLDL